MVEMPRNTTKTKRKTTSRILDERRETAIDLRYAIVIEAAENNFSAYVPSIPGCVATGATVTEVESKIREAIAFHVEGLLEDGLPIPPASSKVEYAEVTA